jgi:hypothetical protein
MRTAVPAFALALALAYAHAAPARACGGMVFPDHAQRVGGMSEQELLIAFTPDSTVLLASAGYKGAAGSPAFILPLPAQPTMVTQADPGVLLALDELTAPSVSITTASDSGGGLCGSALKDGSGGGDLGNGRGDGDVMVLQRGSTADYDYVLVGGDTGEGITDWLTGAGYVLPADYAAALTPYVDAGRFIFAAKVKSSAADGALAPIELHLPAGEPGAFSIPFSLAAHSLPPGETLTLTTYLLATGTLVPAITTPARSTAPPWSPTTPSTPTIRTSTTAPSARAAAPGSSTPASTNSPPPTSWTASAAPSMPAAARRPIRPPCPSSSIACPSPAAASPAFAPPSAPSNCTT